MAFEVISTNQTTPYRIDPNDVVTLPEGVTLNDLINGFTGDHTIRDDGGDDRITGGDGRDVMRGGSGRDVFIFEDLSDSGTAAARDRIYDFQSGKDTFDISALPGPAFAYRGSAAFSASGSPDVRAVSLANGAFVHIDANGDGTRDSDSYLIGTNAVTEGDFLLLWAVRLRNFWGNSVLKAVWKLRSSL